MVREFDEREEEMGRRSVVKEASGFAEELGVRCRASSRTPPLSQDGTAEVSSREAKRGSKKSAMVGKSSYN